jgi:hypothetical protein
MARTVTPPPLPVDESEEISDIDQEDDFEPALTSHRIIDWVKVFTTPVLVTFNVFLISIALEELSKQTPNPATLGQVMYVVGILGLIAVPIVFSPP